MCLLGQYRALLLLLLLLLKRVGEPVVENTNSSLFCSNTSVTRLSPPITCSCQALHPAPPTLLSLDAHPLHNAYWKTLLARKWGDAVRRRRKRAWTKACVHAQTLSSRHRSQSRLRTTARLSVSAETTAGEEDGGLFDRLVLALLPWSLSVPERPQ